MSEAIVATGAGLALGTPCDPTPFLKQRKMRKFMGPQDDLATVAAARAVASSSLPLPASAGSGGDPAVLEPARAGARAPLGGRAGLYIAVGYLPFEAADMDALHERSLDGAGRFDMARFSTAGFESVSPLLTFRCLSNMPAFHVSLNLGIEGPYAVLYPTAAEAYAALEEAVAALEAGAVDVALWGGVAHQRNALVRHHHLRARTGVAPDALADAAAFVVLEREADASRRGARARARLGALTLSYEPHDPLEGTRPEVEAIDPPREEAAGRDAGAAGPALALAEAIEAGRPGPLAHAVATRTFVDARATWEVLA